MSMGMRHHEQYVFACGVEQAGALAVLLNVLPDLTSTPLSAQDCPVDGVDQPLQRHKWSSQGRR